MILVFIMNKTILNDYGIFMMVYIIMTAFKCLPDEYCGKAGKYIGLDKCHQDLDEINKNGEGNGNGRESPTHAAAQVTKDEDQRNETDNDDVARDHGNFIGLDENGTQVLIRRNIIFKSFDITRSFFVFIPEGDPFYIPAIAQLFVENIHACAQQGKCRNNHWVHPRFKKGRVGKRKLNFLPGVPSTYSLMQEVQHEQNLPEHNKAGW